MARLLQQAWCASHHARSTRAHRYSWSPPVHRLHGKIRVMTILTKQAKHSKRLLLASTIIPAAVVAGIVAMPKDETHAANSRLVLTNLTFAALLALVVGGTLAMRRYREARLRLRFAKGTRAIKDTVGFLLEEKKQSRRGRLTLMGG